MATTIRRWTVPAEGEGRPDYTGEQFRSAGYLQYQLRYGETLKTFIIVLSTMPSLFPYVQPPLAAGTLAHLIDPATGLSLPITIPQGYALRFLCDIWSFNQLSMVRTYFDTVFTGESYGRSPGTFYMERLEPINTSYFDPIGASAHLWDMTITNLGAAPMSGHWANYVVQFPLGTTPPAKMKTVKCRACEATKEVLKRTTKVKCSKCGETTWYYAVVDWENPKVEIRL